MERTSVKLNMSKANKKTLRYRGTGARFFKKTGFILIFAILVGSMLLAIGIAISNLVFKELSIVAVSRESQIAFYAADSGAECALYWDVQGPYLTSSSNPPGPFSFASPDPEHPSVTGTISCGTSNDQPTYKIVNVDGGVSYYENDFTVHYGSPSPCAVVSLKKKIDKGSIVNIIDSRGINDCSSTDNDYRVERILRVEYR